VTGGPPLGPPDHPDDQPDDRPPREGRLAPLPPSALATAAVLGLVGGWLLHPVAERVNGTAPMVGWLQGVVLFFVAVLLGVVARHTARARDGAERLEPHRAVNRLVLARACALVGALVAGGYAGYAVSWLGDPAELADQRVWRSVLAAVGGVAIVIAALWLERACRIPPEEPHA
jgi:hypothetical protein